MKVYTQWRILDLAKGRPRRGKLSHPLIYHATIRHCLHPITRSTNVMPYKVSKRFLVKKNIITRRVHCKRSVQQLGYQSHDRETSTNLDEKLEPMAPGSRCVVWQSCSFLFIVRIRPAALRCGFSCRLTGGR